jgi:hypothetical protein
LVGLFRDIITNVACGITRIFFDVNPHRIERKMLGRIRGAAVKLDADEEVTLSVCVGEGVETTMAGRQLGYRQAWALGSSGAIGTFPVLSGLEGIVIFAENDNGASRKNADACCERYVAAGLDPWVIDPKAGDKDLNDTIKRSA